MRKRFSVTLDVDVVHEFQEFAASLNLRPGAMTKLCEDSIKEVTASMKKFKAAHAAKGELTMSDFFSVIGEQLAAHELEEKEEKHVEEQKRAAAPRKKRA